jgi:hypothetical protein
MPQLIVIKIVRIEADISSRNGRRCGWAIIFFFDYYGCRSRTGASGGRWVRVETNSTAQKERSLYFVAVSLVTNLRYIHCCSAQIISCLSTNVSAVVWGVLCLKAKEFRLTPALTWKKYRTQLGPSSLYRSPSFTKMSRTSWKGPWKQSRVLPETSKSIHRLKAAHARPIVRIRTLSRTANNAHL